jgi:putative ATP-binding cassette transporter
VTFAVVAGLVAGASSTGLLVLINGALSDPRRADAQGPWGFAVLCLLMLLGRGASSVLLIRLARGAVYELRMSLSRRFLAAPLRQLEEMGAPRLLAALSDDVPVVANALVTLPLLCMNVAVVATCLAYLCWLSWQVFLGVIGFMLLGILTYYLPLLKGHRYLVASRQQLDLLFRHFRALTEGVKELKLHRERRRVFLADHLDATATQLRRSGFIGDTVYALAISWGQLLVFALLGLLLFSAPALDGVGARTLTGYSLVVLYMMLPLEFILNALTALGRAGVALRNVEELGLSLEADAPEPPGEAAAGFRYESLELLEVEHAYHREDRDSSFVLGPISLSFGPGEVVFIVGGNGSGKTTLAKLITGLYTPEAGEIRLNGRAVQDEMREPYRQLFSAVFSDFYLFESLLGLHSPQLDAQAREYLTSLHLHHKVEVEGGVLSTVELSQGQRKRLALMTAYLEDRPFYLFDEWAADQDPLFKEVFYLRLLPALKERGKTVLVITHDDRYYHVADRVIKLDCGKVELYRPAAAPETVFAGAG